MCNLYITLAGHLMDFFKHKKCNSSSMGGSFFFGGGGGVVHLMIILQIYLKNPNLWQKSSKFENTSRF